MSSGLSQATYDTIRRVVREYYAESGEGRIVCPVCLGGSDEEACMTVYESDSGGVLATCHRANCPVDTVVALSNTCRVVGADPPSNKEVCKEHRQRIRTDPLQSGTYKWLQGKYEFQFNPRLMYKYVLETADSVVFPMYDYSGTQHGNIVKPRHPKNGYKSLTYLSNKEYDGMSWYTTGELSDPDVFVVEDVISALCLHHLRSAVVSLNGTHMNRDRIDTLLRHKWRVVLMLDADATRKAVKYAAMYGPDVVRVVRLVRDIKDMSNDDVKALLQREDL